MKPTDVDIMIVGAGPVGLMCAYLAQLSGMSVRIIDRSEGPLKVGRADALNARTLQLFETVDLFDEVYSIGKKCNTSSVWSEGEFKSRQSSWWESIEGCFHKHFLMIGQHHIEKIINQKLLGTEHEVQRKTTVKNIELDDQGCLSTLSNGELIRSKFLIGADGSRSYVRNRFKVPFNIIRPQIVWAVIDGKLKTDFPKVPEIIVFQNKTSDVAWIPREEDIDRFYIRMDRKDFTQEEVMAKINAAVAPHKIKFERVDWFSQFTVKESVAEKYSVDDKVFLAGDSCHIHSVNGGQGLNTGLADAFNLIWKLKANLESGNKNILDTYEQERMPVAHSVIETSGELVRSTKYSANGTHAEDYVKIVESKAGNITGMGIRYDGKDEEGTRLFDFVVTDSSQDDSRIYSHLSYKNFATLEFTEDQVVINGTKTLKTAECPYKNCTIRVRPDTYIDQRI